MIRVRASSPGPADHWIGATRNWEVPQHDVVLQHQLTPIGGVRYALMGQSTSDRQGIITLLLCQVQLTRR